MDESTLIMIVVGVVVIVLAIALFALFQQRQTAGLRGRFGSEYDRTLRETGSRARAEADLKQREKRVERLNIRQLSSEDSFIFFQPHFRSPAAPPHGHGSSLG
ncbi:hypothetical protein [Geomonas azotofigens]|uniref:hypothetical protein n=1 Tax=Geomonas azotofigens TaxID=2843196 RepID=UPI001C119B99|nr:hypothetical protein [Geomonas azotofigens]MBU5614182.1 hypothetical protein [Geomonas azotofigens]